MAHAQAQGSGGRERPRVPRGAGRWEPGTGEQLPEPSRAAAHKPLALTPTVSTPIPYPCPSVRQSWAQLLARRETPAVLLTHEDHQGRLEHWGLLVSVS